MSFQERFDEPLSQRDTQGQGQHPTLSALDLMREGRRAPDRPEQFASLGRDLTSLAAAAATGCDVLFGARQTCDALCTQLNKADNPSAPGVGATLDKIIRNGSGTLEMQVSRLNDYLSGQASTSGIDTGVRASFNPNTHRLVLTNAQTGHSAEYSVTYGKTSGVAVSNEPVARSYRPR